MKRATARKICATTMRWQVRVDEHEGAVAGDGEADGDAGHDEDGEDGSGKAEAEDDEEKGWED